MIIGGVFEMHNIGIIGLGKMGKIGKNIIDSIPDCSLKWVCDVPICQI